MTHTKRFFKQTFTYAVGDFSTRLLNFIFIPLYIIYLTPEQLGVIALIHIMVNIGSLSFGLGVPIAASRFLAMKRYEQKVVFGTSFLFTALLSLLITAIMLRFTSFFNHLFIKDTAYLLALKIGALSIPFIMLNQIIQGVWKIQEKPIHYSIFQLVITAITLGFAIFFIVVKKYNATGVLAAQLTGYVVGTIFGSLYFAKMIFSFDRNILKKMIKFGFPLIPHKLSMTVHSMADRYLIRLFWGLEAVGIYALAYKIGQIVTQLVTPFQTAWVPFVFNYAELEGGRQRVERIGKIYIFYIILIGCLVALGAPWIIKVFSRNGSFAASQHFIPIIVIAHMLLCLYNVVSFGIILKRKTYLMPLISATAAFVNIVLNILFIPRYGIAGAAWTTVVSALLMFYLANRISQKCYAVNFGYCYAIFFVFIPVVYWLGYVY